MIRLNKKALLRSSNMSAAIIAGVQIGTNGQTGSIYEGFTLNWGDEFDTLDIVRPSNGRGKYFPVRTYLAGARGSDTLLGSLYDTDPYHTGFNDSNRGNAVGYDNMAVTSGELKLQARRATEAEKAHFQGTGRLNVAAMISGAGAVGFYPDVAGTGDILIEARIKYSNKTGNPAGWHPTFWTQSCLPTLARDSDEIDFEGNSQGGYLQHNVWNSAGVQTTVEGVAGVVDIFDDTFHVVTLKLNKSQVVLYIDGVETKTAAWNANIKNKLASFLLTNHIYTGDFKGDLYNAYQWSIDPDGATMTIDWVRCWAKKPHYKPLQSVSDVNAILGIGTNITIPNVLNLWGDATVTEYLQCQMTEENEPAASHTVGYGQFPDGVSYNSGTRVLTVNPTDTKSGRLNFIMYGYKPDGSTCEPLRFCVNFAPVINISSLDFSAGQAVIYDIYAACDCGQLVSNSLGQRAKTITITGLTGSGLSYNDATGLLTGTANEGTYNLTISCTNSIGQTSIKNVTSVVAPAAANFTEDAFVGAIDTNITAQPTDTGGTWIGHGNTPNAATYPVKLDGGGGLMNRSAAGIGSLVYYTSEVPPSADYTVSGTIEVKTIVADEQIGLLGRVSTGALTYYLARYNTLGGVVQLYKSVAGTLTLLGSYTASWAAGTSHTIDLVMVGSNINVRVDGTTQISATDSGITAAGRAGIRMYNTTGATPTTGLHLNNFSAI